MPDEVLRLERVRKSYDKGNPTENEVLHSIDLVLRRGEFAALIGPSACRSLPGDCPSERSPRCGHPGGNFAGARTFVQVRACVAPRLDVVVELELAPHRWLPLAAGGITL